MRHYYIHILPGGRLGRIFAVKRNAIGYRKIFGAIGIICCRDLNWVKEAPK